MHYLCVKIQKGAPYALYNLINVQDPMGIFLTWPAFPNKSTSGGWLSEKLDDPQTIIFILATPKMGTLELYIWK